MAKQQSTSSEGKAPKIDEKKAVKGISKKLADGGFHNCTRVKLVKGSDNNIAKFGDEVNKIKAMHESNIDEYNTQQLNSLLFIKKDGVEYELDSLYARGRVNAKGEPHPYKIFVEVKK